MLRSVIEAICGDSWSYSKLNGCLNEPQQLEVKNSLYVMSWLLCHLVICRHISRSSSIGITKTPAAAATERGGPVQIVYLVYSFVINSSSSINGDVMQVAVKKCQCEQQSAAEVQNNSGPVPLRSMSRGSKNMLYIRQ